MTIKRLKEAIANIPDNSRIYLDDGTALFEGNSEVVSIVCNDSRVVLQKKEDFDVGEELSALMEYYKKNNWNEYDAFLDLGESGYTVEDFEFDPQLYEYVKEFSKTHAW